MTRCKRKRIVSYIPDNKYFKAENSYGEDVLVTIDEIESFRLSDFLKFDQIACAEKMGISRTTLQRTLNKARFKIADAIVNGKNLKIKGGDYMYNNDNFEFGCPKGKRGKNQNFAGRGQGGIGRGLQNNTTGRCRINPDMPAGFRRGFVNSNNEINESSLLEYAENLKEEYEKVMKELKKKED